MIVPVDCACRVRMFTSRLVVQGLPLMRKPIRMPHSRGHDFHPAMNRMMSTRHRATVCRVERSERHWDQIAAFAVRQVAMREMHQASRNAAATLPTPESTDEAFCEVTEELTALRDLYEEAPLAYVKEDLQSRFISANRAAPRIL